MVGQHALHISNLLLIQVSTAQFVLYSGHKWLTAAPCHFYSVLALRESELARSNLFCVLIFEYTSVKSIFALAHMWVLKVVSNIQLNISDNKNHFGDGFEMRDTLRIERVRRWISTTRWIPPNRGTTSSVNKRVCWGSHRICTGQIAK